MNGKVRMMQTLGRFRDGIVRAFQTDRVVSTEADFIVALTSKNVGTIRLADDIVLRKPIVLNGVYNTVIDGGGRFGFRKGRKNTANHLFDFKANTVSDLIFTGVAFHVSGGYVLIGDDNTAAVNNFRFENIDLYGTLFGRRGATDPSLNNVAIDVRLIESGSGGEGIYTYTGVVSYDDVGGGGAYYKLATDYGGTYQFIYNGEHYISAQEAAYLTCLSSTRVANGEFKAHELANNYIHTEQTHVAPTLNDVFISGPDPTINIGEFTNIRVQQVGATSGNASLSAGIVTGQQALIIFEGTQSYSIPSTGTFKSHSNFNPSDHDTLLVVWNGSHGHWLEVSRSNN